MSSVEPPKIVYKKRKETKLLILHDSHTRPDVIDAAGVPRWADLARDQGLQMGLLNTGYHFIIERDGTVVPCREVDVIGSHTPGLNMESIGICLVGGRDEEGGDGVDNFTKEQRYHLVSLLAKLRADYPGVRIKGHSELQKWRNKALPPCPPIDMDLLREDVDLFMKGYYVNE